MYTLSNFRKLPNSGKEVLGKLNLSSVDVLTDIEDKRVRQTNIDKALALAKSNLFRTAVIIKDSHQMYKHESAIVAASNTAIKTASGITIPLECIYSVDFY